MPSLSLTDLVVTSPDFEPDARLADAVAGPTRGIPPRLAVSGIPGGTVELALVVHDPDAPLPRGFTHWTLYGLPARGGALDVDAGRPGPNDAGGVGYTGPNPPVGHGVHHYYFWIYALSRPVQGAPSRGDFLDRYAGSIIGQNRIVGTYSR